MLDSFLKVAVRGQMKKQASVRLGELMRKLPWDERVKIASGKSELNKVAYLDSCTPSGGHESWLDRFKGTPLFDQAIAIEQKDLEQRMADRERRQEQDEAFKVQDASRDELMIQRKLLDLELAKLEAGQPAHDEGSPVEEAAEHIEEAPAVVPAVAAPAVEKEPKTQVDVKTAALTSAREKIASARYNDLTEMERAAIGAELCKAAGIGGAMLQGAKGIGNFLGNTAGNLKAVHGMGGMAGVRNVLPHMLKGGIQRAAQFAMENPAAAGGLAGTALGGAALAGHALANRNNG